MDLMDINLPLLLLTVSLAIAIGLLVAAAQQPTPIREAQQLWSAGLIAAPFGMVLLKLSEYLAIASIAVMAKTMLTAAFIACLLSLGSLAGRRPALKLALIPMLLVPLASVAYLFQHPGQPMRTGLLSLICAGICLGTARLGWSGRTQGRWPHARLVAALFGIGAVLLLLRAVLLLDGNAVSTPTSDWLLAAGVLIPPLATVGFALACGDRLTTDLERRANEDGLTGLLTRRAFMEQAGRALRDARDRATGSALLLIDVDDFKTVNDQFGHAEGDRALSAIAATMQATLRDQDRIGRIGGDEFAVFLVGVAEPQAQRFVQRLHEAIGELRFAVGNVSIPLWISVGMAADVHRNEELDELLKRADRAMYTEKRTGTRGARGRHGAGDLDQPARA